MLNRIAFLVFFSLALGMTFAQSQIYLANYTPGQANATIQNVSAYVEEINQSAYLIFKPNLTTAYKDLSIAKGNMTSNPNYAVRSANSAYESAKGQYTSIKDYELGSLPIVVGFTIVMILLLYKFMTPIKVKKGYRGRKG